MWLFNIWYEEIWDLLCVKYALHLCPACGKGSAPKQTSSPACRILIDVNKRKYSFL